MEPVEITTGDGLTLEGELSGVTPDARVATVLCHPHPQFGGTMRSIVIGALFDALPRLGVACLRFNFRGVERSEGTHGEGVGELLDARAAIATLAARVPDELPLLLAGWSFGGDVALGTVEPRIAAWLAIAPPLRVVSDFSTVARDERSKLLALAEHDEYRSPSSIEAETASWTATEIVVVGGASHFFMGRTDRLVEVAAAYVERLASPGPR
jgi:alpha/beta superfamily hydrolase